MKSLFPSFNFGLLYCCSVWFDRYHLSAFSRDFHAQLLTLCNITFQVLWLLLAGTGLDLSSFHWLFPTEGYFCCPSSTLLTNSPVRHTFPQATYITFIARKGFMSHKTSSVQILSQASVLRLLSNG